MQIDTRNPEFQDALNLIQYTRQSVFLTGKAGTGKSTFLKLILYALGAPIKSFIDETN